MLSRFLTALQEERERWLLWLPAGLAAGIGLYFALPHEPALPLTAALLALSFSGLWLARKQKIFFIFFIPCIVMATGFSAAHLRTYLVEAPVLKKEIGPVQVHGTVEDIDHMRHGYRLLLRSVDIWKYPYAPPLHIRLNIRTQAEGIEPGDRLSLKAVLSPPPRPVFPGGYDFSRYAFFQRIGAVGYSVSSVRIKAKAADSAAFPATISRIRHAATARIHKNLAEEAPDISHIAAAMLTGKRAGLGKKTAEIIRNAGIAHLLSISGLHLALVCMTVFTFLRSALALIPGIALRHNTKKWAAAAALIAGFGYLLIAGMPVPACRAYVMAALFFLCILWDRISVPMRPVAWAAIIILLIAPESLLNPGFQMSFAAVTALIASYETLKRQSWLPERRTLSLRFSWYVASLLFSSLVAGLATAPYGIAHFGNYALYGILGNLFAVPLSSIVIMPFGAAALALMPIGLEYPALWVMGKGIETMLQYSAWVSSLPYASIAMPTLDTAPLVFISVGGLWLCLWQRRIRLCGLPLMGIGILIASLHIEPDIIIDERGTLFALRGADNSLIFSDRIPARYARTQWQIHDGQKNAPKLSETPPETSQTYCTNERCIYHAKGMKTVIIPRKSRLNADAMQQLCREARIFIALNRNDASCPTAEYAINGYALQRRGTYALWLGENINVQTVEGERGQRPWSRSYQTE